MRLAPRAQKVALTAHVTASVGWLGAVVAYLALAIAALSSADARFDRGAYLSMELVGWFVVLPFCAAAFVTGLVQSLGTEWGLFRHYWIVAKLALTAVASAVLVVHLPTVTRMALAASETSFSPAAHGPTRAQLVVHAAGGLGVLLTATVLSVFKPWGLTPYGRRQRAMRANTDMIAARGSRDGRRPSYGWITVIVLALVFLALMLMLTGALRGR
jgi:hypothetical protein